MSQLNFWKAVHFLMEGARRRGNQNDDPVRVAIERILWDGALLSEGIANPWMGPYTDDYTGYTWFRSCLLGQDSTMGKILADAISDNLGAFPAKPRFRPIDFEKDLHQLEVAWIGYTDYIRMPFTHLKRRINWKDTKDCRDPTLYWHHVPLTS